MVEDATPGASPAAKVGSPKAENRSGAIEPDNVKIWEDEFRQLHLRVGDEEFVDLRVVRVFPISGKADHVSFLDEQGKEVALLAHPRGLDKASRNALGKAFDRMYYVPKIVRVLAITESFGMSRWEVMTDRGYAAFEITDREGIRKESDGRYLIHDPDGNRYEIENLAKLDAASRAMLQSEL
jgi:catechol 2,3-dioxygenase-like lactoylglutathione lyase family enzyme